MRWLVVAALASCGGPPSASERPVSLVPPADAIAKVTENGPVKASVKVWPPKPTLGDPIYLRLEVEAPAGISIDAPFQEAGDQRLGRFKVIAYTKDTERKPDGGQLQHQTYTLEAQTSGRHRIPPLRLEMLDARQSGGGAPPAGLAGGAAAATPRGDDVRGIAGETKGKPQELLTDEVPLEIAPVKTEAVDAELKRPLGELDPTVGGVSPLLVVGVASGLLVLGSGAILLFRMLRTRKKLAQQRSAYDEAVAQLRALEDRGAPDSETADAWFVALSSIVRSYVEHRYEIRAPELTTEEFLLVATARPEVREEHRGLLSSFLERCDRVKFAGYRPDADESLATLAAARGFVEDTRLREEAQAAA